MATLRGRNRESRGRKDRENGELAHSAGRGSDGRIVLRAGQSAPALHAGPWRRARPRGRGGGGPIARTGAARGGRRGIKVAAPVTGSHLHKCVSESTGARQGVVPHAYCYVGPAEIQRRCAVDEKGRAVTYAMEFRVALATIADGEQDGLTYVVTLDGVLRLAERRSEHIACAGGDDVLAAGEMRLSMSPSVIHVVEVSNLSTGYCPDVDSYEAVAKALRFPGVRHPGRFTRAVVFRRCPRCGSINLVKDGWFDCVFCDAPLPSEWNVSARRFVP